MDGERQEANRARDEGGDEKETEGRNEVFHALYRLYGEGGAGQGGVKGPPHRVRISSGRLKAEGDPGPEELAVAVLGEAAAVADVDLGRLVEKVGEARVGEGAAVRAPA